MSWLQRPKKPFFSGSGAEQVVVPQGLLTGAGALAEDLPPMLVHPVRVRLAAATKAARAVNLREKLAMVRNFRATRGALGATTTIGPA